ncbi:hypothetical protein CPB84DRAFT_1523153 [Gymnopilus junonius]|uniref:Uncharacterized protein n=1 Tax=Gymnopilus junonius TaxID=109634 RepID=A0A9P5NHQ5_GYMJU|nr:hypothetical protein CPB84DRAFT_1523153 [Gymnopilus junonius]
MKERNEGIERDVQRFLERKKIEHDIALLKVLVPVAQYREMREKFVQVKAKQRQLHGKVQRLKEKNAPAHEKLRQLDQDHKNADADRDALKKASQSKFKRLADKARASDRLEAEMSRTMDELINLRDSEKQRQTQIKSLQKEIQRLEEEIAKPPPEGLATEEEVMEEGVSAFPALFFGVVVWGCVGGLRRSSWRSFFSLCLVLLICCMCSHADC